MVRPHRHTILVLLMLAFFSILGSRFILSPLVPSITADLAVSNASIGLALTGIWAAYGLFQLPGGILAGRYGERPVILAGLGFNGVGCLLIAIAPTFPSFALAGILLGAGGGLYYPVAMSLLNSRYENTGQVLGFHIAGGDVAGLIAPIVAVTVGLEFGWRAAVFVAAITSLGILGLLALRLESAPPTYRGESLREGLDPAFLLALLSRPSLAYTIGIAVVLAYSFQAVVSFIPTFLVEYRGFSATEAGGAFSIIFLLLIVLQPVSGRISDVIGRDVVLGGCMVVIVAGLALAFAGPSIAAATLGASLVGAGMTWGGVLGSRFMDHLAPQEISTGYGLVRTVYVMLGSLGSFVTGAIADTAGWAPAFGVVAGLLIVALGSLSINRVLRLGL